MSIDRKLAQLEVLGEAIRKNASEELNRSRNHDVFLEGILTEAKNIEELRRKASKEIGRRNYSASSHHTSAIALGLKNMAENLNKFIQTIYSTTEDITLKTLRINSSKAPILDSGESFYELFSRTHDFRNDAPVKKLRDSNSHAQGHNALIESKGTYLVQTQEGLVGADQWIEDITSQYFSMANAILSTMLEKDNVNYASNKTSSVNRRIISNYAARHRKTALSIGAAILLTIGTVGGSLGTIAYNEHQAKKETQNRLCIKENEFSHLMYLIELNEGIRKQTDAWEASSIYEYNHILYKKIEEIEKHQGPKELNMNNHVVQNYYHKKELKSR